MASSRDDFIIAIRSAFLKRSTQQKFSLLTLLLISAFVIVLSSLDLKVIRYLKIGINEIVYRSSFIVSLPENAVIESYSRIKEYSNLLNKEYRHYTKINFDEPFRIFLSLVFHRLDNFQKNKKDFC